MIIREHYIKQIRPFYDSDLVKIITGIRRCGKSKLMDALTQIIKDSDPSGNIIHINYKILRIM